MIRKNLIDDVNLDAAECSMCGGKLEFIPEESYVELASDTPDSDPDDGDRLCYVFRCKGCGCRIEVTKTEPVPDTGKDIDPMAVSLSSRYNYVTDKATFSASYGEKGSDDYIETTMTVKKGIDEDKIVYSTEYIGDSTEKGPEYITGDRRTEFLLKMAILDFINYDFKPKVREMGFNPFEIGLDRFSEVADDVIQNLI